ncbi:TonB system transport protein ExbB [Arcobacter venerupis]|uniref:TonB system transport protein ExbB n=1 Tax=Arcobacter venerupis TaxID=1054033 RepID=A0AAE7BAM4_9BACT|nr:MotA/TolQ/ExbB proton channel family protein [Arcobacter venerupis]QKF68533.1 TonB system transport protein ExbB [Arcobacter venerupis]RWS48205.1 hypothetical protein CKA56_15450 [Arcobacter venerupis]
MNENYLNLMDYVDKAGMIGYILLILFTLGISIMIWKSIHIFYFKSTREKYLQAVLEKVKEIADPTLCMKVSKSIIDEKMSELESGMSTIRIVASISPLLGLLGTVIGILQAFDVISKTGLGEPTAFAAGISLALITTVMGLIIAIPHYVGYNYLVRSINHFESVLLKEIDFKILKK